MGYKFFRTLFTVVSYLLFAPHAVAQSSRIILNSSMLSAAGEPRPYLGNMAGIVDEQNTVGDPRSGAGSAANTAWGTASWNAADYGMGFVIDLGQDYDITDIGMYDMEGQGIVQIDSGTSSSWVNRIYATMSQYQRWQMFSVSFRTRYLHVVRMSTQSIINEIVVYGTPVGAPPPTGGTSVKLSLNPSMARVESASASVSNYSAMLDEQASVGDPRSGSGGAPGNAWQNSSWSAADYPIGFYIDLGQDYVITHVALYDGVGNDSFFVSSGSPGAWTNQVYFAMDGYNVWKVATKTFQTRYVKLSRGMSGYANEIVLYGYPAGGAPAPNQPPVVNAGSSQSVQLPSSSVNLSGSAQDPDGAISSVQWSQVSGPATAVISSPGSTTTTVSQLSVQGTYSFRLQASDNQGASGAATVSVTVSPSPPAPTGRGTTSERYASASRPGGYGYVEYLPAGYATGSNFPLVIFLHGAGQRGSGQAGSLGSVRSAGWQREIDQAGKDYPFIHISPQTNGDWSFYEAQYSLAPFVDWLIANYKVDPKRVYLTGLSLGGSGTWAFASQFASKLAAIIPICGGDWGYSAAGANNIVSQGVSIWTAHAKDDGVVPVMPTDIWMSLIGNRLGVSGNVTDAYVNTSGMMTAVPNPGANRWDWISGRSAPGKYNYTRYGSGGHGIWDSMYQDPQVHTWMLNQSRP